MRPTVTQKRSAFRSLHHQGCFVLPNPWDIGSARALQHLGFAALASTSAGYAWTSGRSDHAVTRNDVLEHLAFLCDAVDLPVNADFESGFASDPEGVAQNVILAVETGVAGLSIEDQKPETPFDLYDKAFAIERIRAARAAIDRSGEDVILVGRSEGLLGDRAAINPTIDRLVAFAEAGADCLYAPGVQKKAEITALVRAVAPKPLNVLVMDPSFSVNELADLGVRRISLGSALARVCWSAMLSAAEQIGNGSFDGLASATPSQRLNEIFNKWAIEPLGTRAD